jgi:8-amino-7-oxononanoate synthase
VATIHTGGKALGSGGAWVAGSRTLRDLLVNRARTFIFSTAPLPVLGTALRAGLELVAREPERRHEVHRKSHVLRTALREAGVRTGGESMIVPVIAGTNDAAIDLQAGLLAAGFDVRAIRPPTVPVGTARLRVTVRYPVSDPELRRLSSEIGRLLHAAVR